MPSWGFSLAVSGSTIPDLVFSSFSTGLSTTRSPSGLRFMYAPSSRVKWLLALPGHERLALRGCDCQCYTQPVGGGKPPGLARSCRLIIECRPSDALGSSFPVRAPALGCPQHGPNLRDHLVGV